MSESEPPTGFLRVSLLRHQKLALNWMLKREGCHTTPVPSINPRGGILADDQGLGKTITTISLIITHSPKMALAATSTSIASNWDKNLHNCFTKYKGIRKVSEDSLSRDVAQSMGAPSGTKTPKYETEVVPQKGTLIVCPTSILQQWVTELMTKLNSRDGLDILVYHGAERHRETFVTSSRRIVVTTYQILINERPRQNISSLENENDKCRSAFGLLFRVTWFRVVLDEAHIIRNRKTTVFHAACCLKSRYRWCLTGTPIHNSIDDLLSYLCFLKFEPYNHNEYFNRLIKLPILQRNVSGFKRLYTILNTVLLRRTKYTTVNEEPIVHLPPRILHVVRLELRGESLDIYDRLSNEFKKNIEEITSKEANEFSYASILKLILKMRQVCTHPALINNTKFSKPTLNSDTPTIQASIPFLRSEIGKGNVQNVDQNVILSTKTLYLTIILDKLKEENQPFLKTATRKSDVAMPSTKLERPLFENILQKVPTTDVSPALPESFFRLFSKEDRQPNKVIIYSQWASMLDVISRPFNLQGIKFVRLDGTMSVSARDKSIKDLNEQPDIMVMIVSLKAAAVGLNLVAANHVILLDLWWNPALETQAIDRAHRLGQTRKVTVHRFALCDTIEEKILQAQEKKQDTMQAAIENIPDLTFLEVLS